MKAEAYYLVSETVRENLMKRISTIQADGKAKVTISNTGNKTAKQRGLQFKWYTDVAEAGVGGRHEDTKEGVHLVSKYRWALPILVRDDEFFAELYGTWKRQHGNDEDAMQWFVETQVHTEAFNTAQMTEYLEDFRSHYGQYVNLTDPDQYGLKELLER